MKGFSRSFIAEHPGEQRRWIVVDAAEKPLGRLAVRIANALRGKDTREYTPHVDSGAFVVVVNAEKVKLTGNKEEQKVYTRYSRHPGGLKKTVASVVRERHPDRLITLAVKGMLPSNHLRRLQLRRLLVYAGESHPHGAQAPKKAGW